MALDIVLSDEERHELAALVARRRADAGHVRRARVVLLSADGIGGAEIALRVGLSPEQVSRIRRRFVDGRLAGLVERPKAGRKDHAVTAETIEQIVQMALSPPSKLHADRWTAMLPVADFV